MGCEATHIVADLNTGNRNEQAVSNMGHEFSGRFQRTEDSVKPKEAEDCQQLVSDRSIEAVNALSSNAVHKVAFPGHQISEVCKLTCTWRGRPPNI